MTLKALSKKYYQFLGKLYQNINSGSIKWTKAVNAEYYTAEIDYKFNIRISMTISGLSKNYYFRMFDDSSTKVIEVTSEDNGQDLIEVDGNSYKVQKILEEIYEWAQAYSMDIIGKIDKASDILDEMSKGRL